MINPFIGVINSLLPEPQASLLNGILFGIKANFPKELFQALISTGTIHIIALSGLNISILVDLTAKYTLFLGRKASSIFTICLIAFFVCFVGPSPTIIRAAIMGSLSLLAIYFGRPYFSLLGLFITSLVMLTFDFRLANNLSFQLSFLATMGVILANGKSDRQNEFSLKKNIFQRIFGPIKENFRVTIYAQLFTLPVILYNFKRLSIIAPIANLAIEWAIQPIMVLGFITSILGSIWKPLGIVPSWFTWVPLTYLVKIIVWLAKVPGASIEF